jgi:hypothetical protein
MGVFLAHINQQKRTRSNSTFARKLSEDLKKMTATVPSV